MMINMMSDDAIFESPSGTKVYVVDGVLWVVYDEDSPIHHSSVVLRDFHGNFLPATYITTQFDNWGDVISVGVGIR